MKVLREFILGGMVAVMVSACGTSKDRPASSSVIYPPPEIPEIDESYVALPEPEPVVKAEEPVAEVGAPRPVTTTPKAGEPRTVRITPEEISVEARSIIGRRYLGFDVMRLVDIPRSEYDVPDRRMERVRIDPSELVPDAFVHTLHLDHNTETYWIVRTGGTTDVLEIYGPQPFE